MGVFQLEYFIENKVPGGVVDVNLVTILQENWNKTQERGIIVLDGSSTIRKFYSDLDYPCGGQLKQFADRIEKFSERIYEAGGKLVVFFQGTNVTEKLSTWKGRRYRKAEEIQQFLDNFKEDPDGKNVHYTMNRMVEFLTAKNAYQRAKGSEVRLSVKIHDFEVVEFARVNHAIGIMGQDSDYLIHEGSFLYFSSKHLNFDTLETKLYDRDALLSYLNLERNHLPLLSTLVGNEIVKFNYLLNFHRSAFNRHTGQEVFLPVAGFIKNLTSSSIDDVLLHLQQTQGKNLTEITLRKMKSSLENYSGLRKEVEDDPVSTWDQLVLLAKQRHQFGHVSSSVYNIMMGGLYYSSNEIEDLREAPAVVTTLRRLRAKIYGLLLSEKSKSAEVEEVCVEKDGNQVVVHSVKVKAIFPKSQHPGLRCLWSKGNEEQKWLLFCEAISRNLKYNEVKNLPPHLVFPTVALYYQRNEVKKRFLLDWEVKAFMVQAVHVKSIPIQELESINIEKKDRYAIQLAAKFNRTCGEIEFLNGVCGLIVPVDDSCPSRYFDGLLFQKVYQKMNNSNCSIESFIQDESLLSDYYAMKHIIFI